MIIVLGCALIIGILVLWGCIYDIKDDFDCCRSIVNGKTYSWKYIVERSWLCLLGFFAIYAIILCIILGVSYKSYVNLRTFYDATLEQYSSAVTVYKDNSVIDIDIEKAALTDLKYQGYQENISKFITDLRSNIVDYNESLISKRIMGNNIFLNWLIIKPDDDMKVIKLKTVSGK